MKRRRTRLLGALLSAVLVLGLLPVPALAANGYYTNPDGRMAFSTRYGAFDIAGKINGAWARSSYADVENGIPGGYNIFWRHNGGDAAQVVFPEEDRDVPAVLDGVLELTREFSFWDEGRWLSVNLVVENTSDTDYTGLDLCVLGDIYLLDDDAPYLEPLSVEEKNVGIRLVDRHPECSAAYLLLVMGLEEPVDCDLLWYAEYDPAEHPLEDYVFLDFDDISDDNSSEDPTEDFLLSLSYLDRTIPAGETRSFAIVACVTDEESAWTSLNRMCPCNSWISFHPNGGTGTMEDVLVYPETPYTLPACTFTAPEGKVFDGWQLGDRLYGPGEVYTFDRDTTLFANWVTQGDYDRPEPIIGGLKPSTPEQPVQPIVPDPAAPVFADVSSDAWYAAAVDYCVSKGIMAGTGEGQFAPETETSRGMVVQMLYSLAGKPAAGTSSFSDVSSDAWYADAVAWANSLGIVSGVGENAFAPEQAISREQLALILYKFAQLQGRDVTVDGDTNFMDYTDVRDIHDYAKTAFLWCIQEGLISGTGNDTLSPLTTATRAQLAQIMMNYDKK